MSIPGRQATVLLSTGVANEKNPRLHPQVPGSTQTTFPVGVAPGFEDSAPALTVPHRNEPGIAQIPAPLAVNRSKTLSLERCFKKQEKRLSSRRPAASYFFTSLRRSSFCLSSQRCRTRSFSQVRVRSQVTGVRRQGGARTGEHSFKRSAHYAPECMYHSLSVRTSHTEEAHNETARGQAVLQVIGPLVTGPPATADHRLYTLLLTL